MQETVDLEARGRKRQMRARNALSGIFLCFASHSHVLVCASFIDSARNVAQRNALQHVADMIFTISEFKRKSDVA